ncbi:penicillin-binding protein 1C [Uliginosibacterium sp. H1]|uniref:penicillin-binding protein 1C n=1 Tax=Uliginosibacterium sp. H1 TaxID=3114757 RepID=UPI002E17F757|nr:penicillin-binding protein 1C [Uliginosibacterium sp. H1]
MQARRHPLRCALAGLLAGSLLLDQLLPPPLPRTAAGLVVVAQDGTPLRSWPGVDGVWRYPVSADQVSPLYREALLAYEDRWFRWHPGINPLAMTRAAWQWLRHGRIVSGGSTLTMQVARIMEPPRGRSLWGKTRQMLRALQLEARLSKDEVLALYLNHAPMGGIVEGVEMASRAYLGKPSSQLSHAEAALLVVLPQAPSRLRPDRAPQAAQLARDKVLARMDALGIWPTAVVEDARIERVAANPLRAQWLAPIAAERLRGQARRDLGTRQARGAVAVVRSTLDREMQATLERLLADRVGQLPPHVSMAALVMESDSLAVRAYAGSADFSDARRFNHVDMVRGVRSPGSTLKPFLYAMALDEGLIHSESLMSDVPQSFSGYEPGNFQADFSGAVSVSESLQRSLNVPAVDLLDRVGPSRFAAQLRAGGLRLRMPRGESPNLSLILGGGGTTLEELVGAYRALAAGGLAGQPRLTPDAPRIESRLMSEGAAFIIRDILETGGHPDRPFVEAHNGPRLAWKTGTSFGFRDAWAVGVTDAYTIGIWVGRPDGTPNPGFFGANIAAPLLKDIAAALPAQTTRRKRPASVKVAQVCWPLGGAADATPAAHCHRRRSAWTLNDAIPPTFIDRVRDRGLVETIWLDPHSRLRTLPECNPQALPRSIARWPTQLEPWLSPGDRVRFSPPDWQADCAAPRPGGSLRIAGLSAGTTLRPTPGRRSASITVRSVGGNGRQYWLLDGRLTRVAPAGSALSFEIAEAGAHTLTAMDANGQYASIAFDLKQ